MVLSQPMRIGFKNFSRYTIERGRVTVSSPLQSQCILNLVWFSWNHFLLLLTCTQIPKKGKLYTLFQWFIYKHSKLDKVSDKVTRCYVTCLPNRWNPVSCFPVRFQCLPCFTHLLLCTDIWVSLWSHWLKGFVLKKEHSNTDIIVSIQTRGSLIFVRHPITLVSTQKTLLCSPFLHFVFAFLSALIAISS